MKADEIRRLIINDLFLNMFDEDAEDTLERIDEYAAEVSREVAIDFAGFYYDSVADDPTPKEITPEILYNEFTPNNAKPTI